MAATASWDVNNRVQSGDISGGDGAGLSSVKRNARCASPEAYQK